MEWTEETIARLQDLWKQGLSTAEIGRQLGITKNAVVGKAHRLSLPPRPSPIRKQGSPAPQKAPTQATPASVTVTERAPAPVQPTPTPAVAAEPSTPVPSASPQTTPPPVAAPAPVVVSMAAHRPPEASQPKAVRPDVKAANAAHDTGNKTEDAPVKNDPVVLERPKPAPRPALRTVPAEPRRRGPSCCWPLGDPGTPGFHFCGAPPLSGKPYCAEHAAIAYVKLRDRRDNVA